VRVWRIQSARSIARHVPMRESRASSRSRPCRRAPIRSPAESCAVRNDLAFATRKCALPPTMPSTRRALEAFYRRCRRAALVVATPGTPAYLDDFHSSTESRVSPRQYRQSRAMVRQRQDRLRGVERQSERLRDRRAIVQFWKEGRHRHQPRGHRVAHKDFELNRATNLPRRRLLQRVHATGAGYFRGYLSQSEMPFLGLKEHGGRPDGDRSVRRGRLRQAIAGSATQSASPSERRAMPPLQRVLTVVRKKTGLHEYGNAGSCRSAAVELTPGGHDRNRSSAAGAAACWRRSRSG